MNDLMSKYGNAITILNDLSVDSANLLGAGTHNVFIGENVEFVESKENEEYADRTPQLKVRFWNNSGVFTRWFPLLGYQHYSKMKPSQIEALKEQYDEVKCSSDDFLLVTKDGITQRVISAESNAQCQKRLKDLCYALTISDSELKDETGNSSIEKLIEAISARGKKQDDEKLYKCRLNLYADKQGRLQLGWINRMKSDEVAVVPSVEETEQLG